MSIQVMVVAAAALALGGVDERPDPGPRCPAVEVIGPPEPAFAFGWTLDVDGDDLIVGEQGVGGNGRIFRLKDGDLYEITLADLGSEAGYGWEMAVDDGVVFVAAPSDSTFFEGAGAVYMQDAETGEPIHDFRPVKSGDGRFFGVSIDTSDGMIVVGENNFQVAEPLGAATVFDVATGASLLRVEEVADGDWESSVGREVTVGGGRLAVWTSSFDLENRPPCRVEVYNVASAAIEHCFVDPDSDLGAQFGYALDIEGDLLAVGAPGASVAAFLAGAVYLYDLHSGELIRTITAPDAMDYDTFGASVRLQDGKLLVGATERDGVQYRAGAAYVFEASTGRHLCTLIDDSVSSSAFMGWRSAISDGRVYVSADSDDTFGQSAGSVRVFDLRLPADLDGDGCVGSGDLGVLLSAWGGPAPDLDGDGVAGEGDLGIILAAWGGCR